MQMEGTLSITEVDDLGTAVANAGDGDYYTIAIGPYSATLPKDSMVNSNSVTLKRVPNLDDTDSITIKFPKLEVIENDLVNLNTEGADPVLLTQSVPSKSLGFEAVPFALAGGTAGGPQTLADLTSIAVSDTGVLSAIHDQMGYMELGRIDLATFANPKGMEQVGDTYFEETTNSGIPKIVRAGSEAVGAIASSTLETSNVDLANEFSDMIVTQRGFQASSRIITVSDSMIEELVNLKR
jgi:flagellar hook protein FlgE